VCVCIATGADEREGAQPKPNLRSESSSACFSWSSVGKANSSTPIDCPYVWRRLSIIFLMRGMLLFELEMKLIRHSSGSCRMTRMPGTHLARPEKRASAAAQILYRGPSGVSS
jgi:hypothetical protein